MDRYGVADVRGANNREHCEMAARALKSSSAVSFLARRGSLFQSLTVQGKSDCLRGRPQASVRERKGRYSWYVTTQIFLLTGAGNNHLQQSKGVLLKTLYSQTKPCSLSKWCE